MSYKNYVVIGIEPFNMAEVHGIFSNKKQAEKEAAIMDQNKSIVCCQRYVALSWTEAQKYDLF